MSATEAKDGVNARLRGRRAPEDYCNERDGWDHPLIDPFDDGSLRRVDRETVETYHIQVEKRRAGLMSALLAARKAKRPGGQVAELEAAVDGVEGELQWLAGHIGEERPGFTPAVTPVAAGGTTKPSGTAAVCPSPAAVTPSTRPDVASFDEDDYEDEDEDESAGPQSEADEFADYQQRLTARRRASAQSGLAGVPTGLQTLDAATGGLQGVTVLAGRTQSGKTSLGVQACVAALEREPKLAAVYYLFDNMSADDLRDQMVCHVAGVDHATYVAATQTPKEQERLDAAARRLQKDVLPRLRIVEGPPDDPYGLGLTGPRAFKQCEYFCKSVGAERVLVVIDMFDDIPLPRLTDNVPEEARDDALREVRRVGADPDLWRLQQIVRLDEWSRVACPGGWPILVLAKLRKAVSARHEPELEDLLGSVELGYKANRVYFLIPGEEPGPSASEVPFTLAVKKGRRATADRISLRFHHTRFRFTESPAPAKPAGRSPKPRPADPTPASPAPDPATSGIDPYANFDPKRGAVK